MRFLTIVILSALFVFSGCEDKTQPKEGKTEAVQEKKIQYPITLTATNGENITIDKVERGLSFSNASNQAVLLNFFATWCPPCIAEIPHLNNLQKKHEGKLKIVSVLMEDKNLDQVKQFMEKYNIQYTTTQGEANFDLAKAVGDVQAIPFMILYDKNGKYATHYTGAVPEEMLDVDITKVVK